MSQLVVGVDEVASERQLVEGWTYCVIPEDERDAFERAVAGLRTRNSLVYHGNKFKKELAPEYEAFLREMRSAVEHSAGSAHLIFTLNETSWKTLLLSHTRRLVTEALQQNGLSEVCSLAILQKLFPGLITLQRLLRNLGAGQSIRLEIDQDGVTRMLATTILATPGGTLSLERVLVAIYRGYRVRQFPDAPVLADPGGVSILRDARSRLIQAADVFGNFAMNYALCTLGDASVTRAVKAEVFTRVFGDVVRPAMVTSAAVLQGNEMTLKQSGALPLEISAK